MDCRKLIIKSAFSVGLLALTACGAANSGSTAPGPSSICTGNAIPNQYIVTWKNEAPKEFRSFRIDRSGKHTKFRGVSEAAIKKEILAKYTDQVVRTDHDYELKIDQVIVRDALPSDMVTGLNDVSNWGFSNVQAENAWSLVGKGEDVVVGVIDSGLDTTHPALQGQIYINHREIPSNNIDDDGNGIIDDYMGYDFGDGTPTMTDTQGHGTHVSGIIAAREDSPVTGVAPGAKILPIRFLDSQGRAYLSSALEAIDYAETMHVKVINASWGGAGCPQSLEDKMAELSSKGIVFSNSAGNSGQDLDRSPEFPAAYVFPGKINVGSMDQDNRISWFSNYGVRVDLVAPGGQIYSSFKDGTYKVLDGTSMSAPFVTAVSALLLGKYPNATATQIAAAINDSSINYNYPVRTRGKLNALNAARLMIQRMGN